MTRIARLSSLALVLTLALSSAPAASAAPPGCARGTAQDAAAAVVHPGAEIVGTDAVAGFPSVLVLEPLIHPGVRHRLIRAGSMWCDAEALNAAWALAGRAADPAAMARAYAQLGGVAHFDGVTVERLTQVAPGIFTAQTHALTNGIRATWTMAVDGDGVRSARWTATALAVKPFVAEIEGLSALPGLTRSYRRSESGRLLQQEPLLPQTPAAPELVTEGWTVDDFLIRVSASETGISPNAGQNVGNYDVDFYRTVRDVAVANYNDFHDWGMRKAWSSNLGMIWIDNSTGASCFACVTRSATFNIHMTQRVLEVLGALGFTYPDARKALATVIGHEMYHNWQNSYGQPDFNMRHSSFSEGTARMQETAHDYSDVSHQPDSLIYSHGRDFGGAVSVSGNSCNGWDGADRNAAFANGPVAGKTYSVCYFWLTFYGTHGPAGQVAVLEAWKEAQKVGGDYAELKAGIESATGKPIVSDLLVWARSSLTGHGYEWKAGDGTGTEIDWGTLLERWQPASMNVGATATATIRDGGMFARKITDGGYPTLSSNRAETALAVVRSTSAGATEEILAPGTCVEPPVAGEDLWLVAIHPAVGAASATVGLQPLPAGATQCPEEEEQP